LNSIELFAGIGGLGIGISRAGFQQISAYEQNLSCCETIWQNQTNGVSDLANWNLFHGDTRDFDFRKYHNKIDLVSGGPPCQPFSLGGKHLADLDHRDMFPEAIRAIREIQPKAFIFENVKGLTREAFFNYFEYIRLQLAFPTVKKKRTESWCDHLSRLEETNIKRRYRGLAYKITTRVLNAADYGIPQKRERVFIVGFRSDLDVQWHFPTGQYTHEALLWSQINGDYWERLKVPKSQRQLSVRNSSLAHKLTKKPNSLPWRTLREGILDLPDPEKHKHKSAKIVNHHFKPGARSYPGHTGSPLDEPAKTLKAGSHGVPGGENMLRDHKGNIRYFTLRESARLQGFSDDYAFYSSWSDTIRQLGNAVPVELAEILAKDIKAHLE
jgi:DNA (cytosine-5)-methyltransferase 1